MNIKAFHPIKNVHDGVYNTASGALINLKATNTDNIKIADIANALSHLCRFGGHVNRFYSVAQHSVLVAGLAPKELKKEALLHDAAEAYLGDVIKPLKIIIGEEYELLEYAFQKEINQKFGLDIHKLQVIKEYDMQALELEHKALQLGDTSGLIAAMDTAHMYEGVFTYFYSPSEAKIEFMNQFCLLFPNYL